MNYVDHLDLFGVKAKEIPCNTAAGAPTSTTVGAVGLLYMDINTGDIYKCTAVNGNSYTWELMNYVQYVPQELTEEQKAQVRENIGVVGTGESPRIELSDFSDSYGSGVKVTVYNVDGVMYFAPIYNGKDATSAFATVSKTGNVTTITTKDATGTKTAEVYDGKTPVKGADYFTEEDKEELLNDINAVRFTEQTLTEEQKAQARMNIGAASGSAVEPAEDDIPKVFFGHNLPQTKTDVIMPFRYISKTQDISGYCKTKAQGNHSMQYPKKNQTVKLYKDAACTEKLNVNFKGWGKQNKFCFKANWVDLSHARNIVSARLWGDVVKSRSNYAELPELLRTSPNLGAIDGFPVKVYANGVYQGRYTLNIPKDAWMVNMDDELENHCVLCSENYVSGCFRAAAVIDESDWSDEIHDTVPVSIVTKWNHIISFVMNSTDDEFVTNLGNYIDVLSLVDYYLFGLVSCDLDGFGKNQIFMTYDGVKWYASEYDLDATWGNYYNGKSFVPTDYARTRYQDFTDGEGNLLHIRLEKLFADAIKERWAELKNGALSIENIVNRFERFTDITSTELIAEDCAETTANGDFSDIPGQGANNVQQIRNYAAARLAYCDSFIALLGSGSAGDESILYALPGETVFNGTNHIDTGVTLFDTAKDFSIVIDCSMNDHGSTANMPVCACTNNDGNKGMKFAYNGQYQKYAILPGTNVNGATAIGIPAGVRSKVVITAEAGIVTGVKYCQSGGSIVTPDTYPIEEFTAYPNTLLIGGALHYGSVAKYWIGTVYDLKVYNRILSDDEITAYLS